MSSDVSAIRGEHIEAFLVALQDSGHRPATVANRYRSLQQVFRWLAGEDEIRDSPMARMRPPAVPDEPPPVLRVEELERLLAVCAGTSFEDRRDTAIIRLLASTGMRRGECVGLRVEGVDFDHEVALVLGKGRRPRACPFDRQTSRALDRHLRVRKLDGVSLTSHWPLVGTTPRRVLVIGQAVFGWIPSWRAAQLSTFGGHGRGTGRDAACLLRAYGPDGLDRRESRLELAVLAHRAPDDRASVSGIAVAVVQPCRVGQPVSGGSQRRQGESRRDAARTAVDGYML